MVRNYVTLSKIVRISIFFAFVLIIILYIYDLFLNKIHLQPSPFKINSSPNSFPLHLNFGWPPPSHDVIINVLLSFVHVHQNKLFKAKLTTCLTSLFTHASNPIHLHILTDNSSLPQTLHVLEITTPLSNSHLQVSLFDINVFVDPLQKLIETMRPHFSYKQGAYYSDALFYLSIGLHKIINLNKIIVIDIDVKFLDDIKKLYLHFKKFMPENIIGIASEQQPVYRHILNEYRRLHNDTKIGGPPPDGHPGFNSGVLLLDLEKMRHSILYSQILNDSNIIETLLEKYKFKGHLGDQDFYSLVSLEYPNLFYVLPCTWNRQLCQWWKWHGYERVFNEYHICLGMVKLLHGNCNSLIPDSIKELN